MTQQASCCEVKDLRELLPYFTVAMWGQLARRLTVRVREQINWNGINEECVTVLSRNMANEIVARMYRTQLKAALDIVSFSEALLDFNQPKVDAANERAMLLLGDKAKRLTTMFRARRTIL